MEQIILFTINREWTASWLDYTMVITSSTDFWLPILIAAALLIAIFGSFHARAFLCVVAFTIIINDAFIIYSLKSFTGRFRPHETIAGIRGTHLDPRVSTHEAVFTRPLIIVSSTGQPSARGRSFPSGHTANTFAFAAVAIAFFRRWGWLTLLIAALVGYSRLYLGVHWPSDVLAGACIGFTTGLLVCYAAEAAWKKFLAPRFPAYPSLLGKKK